MLMPGVGFSVVASDCLLALAADRVTEPMTLRLAVSHPEFVARGTLRSAAGLIGGRALIRRDGRLATVPVGGLLREFDFGQGLRSATAISWPDVISGEVTTGVPNIEAYVETGPISRLVYQSYALAVPWTDARAWRATSHAFTRLWPQAPKAQRRRNSGFVLVAETLDRWRRAARLRMRTLDGYTVSVITTAEIVKRVLDGDWSPGFNTPARLFGADLILRLGCASVESA
jgi:saccharopine dehydrogenase (NAD+, L-lysine-forming)